mgnify:CR=1 FL=1
MSDEISFTKLQNYFKMPQEQAMSCLKIKL